ncbi:hypothetical protein DOK_10462 [gamma proteobacterium BDW918]|uniref:Oxidoreductase n=1 Tax=Zhongshania aliphaticivorans TaxID=1470434 RepID=A0A127M5M5_9GAMM|nr:DUF934 domain-containing protein [Zhongshania aliphaticivorans]AMO68491.1 oxidoreductase [Zhongshania aliphaticivorans]EIF43092.1 hypothetical protein DOK_10462 [gamma proteobacterium BDW918]
MPKIIKDLNVVEDSWQVWRDTETLPATGGYIVPLSLWQAHKEELLALGNIAVFLASDQSPKLLGTDVQSFTLIAVDFPKFADGRGFSYGRELREQHGFTGELRAIGDFMRDQLYFLKRCGFNSFALQSDDLDEALASFNDFSDAYQPSIDQALPIFRRR